MLGEQQQTRGPNPSEVRRLKRLHLLYWSIHTKDESKRGTASAFIFDVNWLWSCGVTASFGVFFHAQFTPKMKANAELHLLSSLLWIDSGVVVSQHRLESIFHGINCNGMTIFMEFMSIFHSYLQILLLVLVASNQPGKIWISFYPRLKMFYFYMNCSYR